MFFRIILIFLGLLLTGCRSFKSMMGFDHEGPNEFDVTPSAPLSLPKDFHKTPRTESEACVEKVASDKEFEDEPKYEEKVDCSENKDVSQILFEDQRRVQKKDSGEKLNRAANKKNSGKKVGFLEREAHTYKFLDLINTKTVMKPNEDVEQKFSVKSVPQQSSNSQIVDPEISEKEPSEKETLVEDNLPFEPENHMSSFDSKPLPKSPVSSTKKCKRIKRAKLIRKKRPVKKARRNVVRKPKKNCKKIVSVRKKKFLIKKKTQILSGKGNY